jgi:hypothetical protein
VTYSEQEPGWWVDPDRLPPAPRRPVDHQAVRDAVLFWWEHRREPRGPYEAGQRVGYMPYEDRSKILRDLAGRVGSVLQTLAVDQRLIQFGGEEDGTMIVHIVAELDELLPM